METKAALKWVMALLIGFGIIALGFRFAGWLLTAFFILNCLVLIIVVLLQSGKAADLAGAPDDLVGGFVILGDHNAIKLHNPMELCGHGPEEILNIVMRADGLRNADQPFVTLCKHRRRL